VVRCIYAGQAICTCEGPVSPIIMLLARHECRKKKPEKKTSAKYSFMYKIGGIFYEMHVRLYKYI
jgi:hypothetical protein